MQEIEKLRAEMDQIHIELGLLLKRRLDITQEIWQIKKENQIPFFDSNREELILQKMKNLVQDSDQKIFLNQVFKNILVETKKYLQVKLK